MRASFLEITWERLPARPAALAIYAGTIFPVWQPVRVGTLLNQRTTRKKQTRLPNLIRILLGCLLSPAGVPLRAGLRGWPRLFLLPESPTRASPLDYPKDRRGRTTYPIAPRQSFTRARMAWVLEFFRACRPVRFGSLVQPAKQPSSRFLEGFHSLLCWSLFHAVNLPKDFAHGVQRKSAYGARNDE